MLLTLTLFLQLITEFTPKAAKSLPIVGLYFNFNLLLILISVVLTVIVLNLHFRGPKKDKVPDWMRKFLIGYLGYFLCVICKHELETTTNNKDIEQNEQINTFEDLLLTSYKGNNLTENNLTLENLPEIDEEEEEEDNEKTLKDQSNINEQINKIIYSFKPGKIENNNLKILILKEILQSQINLVNLNEKKLKAKQEMSLSQIYDEWKILAIISKYKTNFIHGKLFKTNETPTRDSLKNINQLI